jgi:hypothetical protein
MGVPFLACRWPGGMGVLGIDPPPQTMGVVAVDYLSYPYLTSNGEYGNGGMGDPLSIGLL